MNDFQALCNKLANTSGAIFIKADCYVPAIYNRSVPETASGWASYLLGEAKMHKDELIPNRKFAYATRYVNFYIGDAAQHTWIEHYRVSYCLNTSRYIWNKV